MDAERSPDNNTSGMQPEQQRQAISNPAAVPKTASAQSSISETEGTLAPIRTQKSSRSGSQQRPSLGQTLTEDAFTRAISRRRSSSTVHSTSDAADDAQIAKLVSRMFGHERKANSDEEKTRHLGVVWKNLTVKGVGLGAAIQPTNSDIFLALPRLVKDSVSRLLKGSAGGPPLRTILDDFTVCAAVGMRN